MWTEVLGDVLPPAVGVALSPMPVVAVILALATPRARTNGLTFALGWVIGLILVTVIGVLLLDVTAGGDDGGGESDRSTVVGWGNLVLGVVLFGLAGRRWVTRPKPGEQPATPGWMSAIDSFGIGRFLVTGAALAALNPKNLALTLSTVGAIADTTLTAGGRAGVVTIYVVIASLTVAGPVAYDLVAADRATGPLTRVKDSMVLHNNVIMMVVLLILGAKM